MSLKERLKKEWLHKRRKWPQKRFADGSLWILNPSTLEPVRQIEEPNPSKGWRESIMNKGILEVYNDRYTNRIRWRFPEDRMIPEGADLGDTAFKESDLKKYKGSDNLEHILASLTAMKTEGVDKDIYGCFWESKKAANKALTVIQEVLKNFSDHHVLWPEWAVKAKSAGWKPPKGWKP